MTVWRIVKEGNEVLGMASAKLRDAAFLPFLIIFSSFINAWLKWSESQISHRTHTHKPIDSLQGKLACVVLTDTL